MKRKVGLLVVALVLAFVTACGGGAKNSDSQSAGSSKSPAENSSSAAPSASDPVELTFYYPVQAAGPLTAKIEAMADQFMKENPDIKVKPIYTGSYADTLVKTLAAVQGKEPPDVAVLGTVEMFGLLDIDAILPLDDFIAKEGDDFMSDFFPALLTNAGTEEHLYSMPFQRSAIVLFYNKEMFEEAGLDPEKPPKTWDEMVEMSKKLTKDGQWGIEIQSSGPSWVFSALAEQNGERLMTQDGKSVSFYTPNTVDALQKWVDLVHKHKTMPEGIIQQVSVSSDFLEKKVAMTFDSSANLTPIKENADFPFGISVLPEMKQAASTLGGGSLFIFKTNDERRQEAAWKFVKFMTDTEITAQWSIDTGYIAVRKSAYETERMKNYIAEFPEADLPRAQLESGVAQLTTHNQGKVNQALNDAIQAALTGAATVEESLKKAQEEADKALAPFNQ